jgi:hypothetical protein
MAKERAACQPTDLQSLLVYIRLLVLCTGIDYRLIRSFKSEPQYNLELD